MRVGHILSQTHSIKSFSNSSLFVSQLEGTFKHGSFFLQTNLEDMSIPATGIKGVSFQPDLTDLEGL